MPRGGSKSALPREKVEAILAAYRAGEKTTVIEMNFGLSHGHARKLARKAGLPPRPGYSKDPRQPVPLTPYEKARRGSAKLLKLLCAIHPERRPANGASS